MQAEGHPVIEFVQSEKDVEDAHRRMEGMNFIPGGYLYTDWGAHGMETGGGVGDGAGPSHAYGTRSTGAGDAGGASSMSIDLESAPMSEVVVRVSPARQPHVSPAGGVGGPPTGNDAAADMEHDGYESSPSHIASPTSPRSPSPQLMRPPASSGQIPGSSEMSPTGQRVEIRQMEALTLQQEAGFSDAGPLHAPVHPAPQ